MWLISIGLKLNEEFNEEEPIEQPHFTVVSSFNSIYHIELLSRTEIHPFVEQEQEHLLGVLLNLVDIFI